MEPERSTTPPGEAAAAASPPMGTPIVAGPSGAAAEPAPSLPSLEALFDDPSPRVWRAVRRELARRGRAASGLLARMGRSGSALARARARQLLLERARDRAVRRLAGYGLRADARLETGLLLLDRYGAPGLDARPHLAALDALGAELLRRVERLPPTLERGRALTAYLGDELGYAGLAGDEPTPDDAYLHRAIERKRGLPLTLAALYRSVAERAGIRASLVGLPGHVVLRLAAGDQRMLVDPFQGGVELSERDCLAYLAERGLSFRARWFQDAGELDMLERQLRNLAVCFRRRGLHRDVQVLGRALRALRTRHGAEPARPAAEARG